MFQTKNNLNRRMGLSLLASMGLVALLLVSAAASAATSPTLGAVGSYSVLAGSIVTNTGATTMLEIWVSAQVSGFHRMSLVFLLV